MTYTLTSSTLATDAQAVQRSDGAWIPPDPGNIDFQAYLTWLAVPNTPNPAPVVSTVPQTITDRQFFQAAAVQGLITEAQALAMMQTGVIPPALATAISTLPAGQQFAAQMEVVGCRTFLRADPFVIGLSTAMGQTSAQVDALFTLAASL